MGTVRMHGRRRTGAPRLRFVAATTSLALLAGLTPLTTGGDSWQLPGARLGGLVQAVGSLASSGSTRLDRTLDQARDGIVHAGQQARSAVDEATQALGARAGYAFPKTTSAIRNPARDVANSGPQPDDPTVDFVAVGQPGAQDRSDPAPASSRTGSFSMAALPANAINPAAVATVAGSGANVTANGVGTGASFSDMGGIVDAGSFVYVGTVGSIRKVEKATNAVTILAGDATATGCTDSTVATQVRFTNLRSLTSDGTYLYSVGDCGLRRTTIATGATAVFSSVPSPNYAVWGNGYLFVTSGNIVYKVSNKGTKNSWATLVTAGHAIAYDSSNGSLWVVEDSWDRQFQKIASNGAVSPPLANPSADIGLTGLAAMNGTLYVSARAGSVLRAYSQSDGSWAAIAGTGVGGYADGTGTAAWMSGVTGIAGDGTRLWIAESGNRRIRTGSATTALPAAVQAAATTTLAMDPGTVTTAAGHTTCCGNINGTGSAARLSDPAGLVVIGNDAYIGTGRLVRRMDLVTKEVSTFVGSESSPFGSLDNLDPAAVRFGAITAMTTDGTYLYTIDSLRVRRTALGVNGGGPAGATSLVATLSTSDMFHITFGPDRALYVGGRELHRVDPASGARTVVSATPSALTYGLSSDATSLWAVISGRLAKIDPATGATTFLGGANAGNRGLVSAGEYVYNSRDTYVRRFSKVDGSFVDIAGNSTAGILDGTGKEGWFTQVSALASDGASLWITDLYFSQGIVRRIAPGQPLTWAQPAAASTTLAITTGAVSTVAGNGGPTNVDGPAATATFRFMGGTVIVGPYAYIAAWTSIRRVHLATGAVSTLAGSPTESSAVDSANASAVRFINLAPLATDGTFIYSLSDWGTDKRIRRTSIATGATTTVYIGSNSLTRLAFGPGNFLYSVIYSPGYSGSTIYRIDPQTGAQTAVASEFPGTFHGLATDAQSLWVTDSAKNLVRVDPATGAKTVVAAGKASDGTLASAGDYVYTSFGSFIRRISKIDGSWTEVAGAGSGTGYGSGSTGLADGTGTEAWFNGIAGLVSDGTSLLVADSGNGRLRRVVAGSALPSSQAPSVNTTVGINPGQVSTFAGNGAFGNVSGNRLNAGFGRLLSLVTVGGYAYVGTVSSIQKVNLATGDVSTLAGHPTTEGAVNSPTGANVRLSWVTSLTTDGTYLYSLSSGWASIAVRRTSLATGATSLVASDYRLNSINYGPGPYLYGVDNSEWSSCCTDSYSAIHRIHVVTGEVSNVVPLTANLNTYGMASDSTWLWAVRKPYPSSDYRLDRIDPTTGASTVHAQGTGTTAAGVGHISSAGDFLYHVANNSVRRISKLDGMSLGGIAGGDSPGYQDGTGPSAYFNSPRGVSSDGTNLWVADDVNYRLRKVVQGKHPVDPGGPTWRETLGGGSSSCDAKSVGGADLLDPVNIATGNFYEAYNDLSVPGRGPAFSFARTYNSLSSNVDSSVGYGWTHNYNAKLTNDPYRPGVKLVRLESGAEVAFAWNGTAWVAPSRLFSTLTANTDGTFTFERRSCGRLKFDAAGRLVSLTDRNGYTSALTYDASGRLSTISDPSSRVATITYSGSRIHRVTDHSGRYVEFTYDVNGNLTDVRDAGGKNTHFDYGTNHLLERVRDPRGKYVTTNTYDAARRVVTQKDALNRTSTISYGDGGVVTVTDPRGNVIRRTYSDGLLLSETQGHGTSQAATWTFGYDPGSLGTTTVTDPNNHTTSATYDAKGNVLTSTDGLQRTTTFTYNAMSEPLTRTNAKNVTTTWTYDASGNRLTESTPLVGTAQTRSTTYHYGHPTRPGEVTAVTDPNGKTWTMEYDQYGNLVRGQDPLGSAARLVDAGFEPIMPPVRRRCRAAG
jgi:YD repeat-containing protein